MPETKVVLPLKRFLIIKDCPAEWKGYNLYLFRDETVTFYVGQSQLAFARVWEHLLGGFHGHSIVGRFVWVNWPASMNFTIELMSSGSEEFADVGHDLNAAERKLIQQVSPCFNTALNSQSTPVPATYLPANVRRPLFLRGLNRLIREAERAVQAEEKRALLKEMGDSTF